MSIERINFISTFSPGSIKTNFASRIEIIENIQQTLIDWLTNMLLPNFEEVLINCEKWGKSKNEEWSIFLDFLEMWFRDISFVIRGFPEEMLINKVNISPENRIISLKKSALHFTIENVQEIFLRILEARKSIELNANKSLIIGSLCMFIYRRTL